MHMYVCIHTYVIVVGINSVSNAGRKIVIVRGAVKHYYYFPACVTRTINSKYYS